MAFSSVTSAPSLEALVQSFFQRSAGEWQSHRRYYTLKDCEAQAVVSHLTVQVLSPTHPELQRLAALHQLADPQSLVTGALTTWESNYVGPGGKTMQGSTVFGVLGNVLYRDRGFSTTKPVTAEFTMRGENIMCLRTEYGGSMFEEEIRLIGTQYRTRQTIISRAGEEQMIGQYLEKRLA